MGNVCGVMLQTVVETWRATLADKITDAETNLPDNWKRWSLDAPDESEIQESMLVAGKITQISTTHVALVEIHDMITAEDPNIELSFSGQHSDLMSNASTAIKDCKLFVAAHCACKYILVKSKEWPQDLHEQHKNYHSSGSRASQPQDAILHARSCVLPKGCEIRYKVI